MADRNRWIGDVSVGFHADGRRIRRRVSGRTKQEVRDKLKALHAELDAGLKARRSYTVRHAVDAWLRDCVDGRSERTRKLYAGLLDPLMDIIGNRQLREVTAAEVRAGLGELKARYSTRSLQITRSRLERAIAHAQADDLVGRNVAALVKVPQGRAGRGPCGGMTLSYGSMTQLGGSQLLKSASMELALARIALLFVHCARSALAATRRRRGRDARWRCHSGAQRR